MRDLQKIKLGFIGFGHMGQLICEGMLKSKVVKKDQILFLRKDKQKQREISKKMGIKPSSLHEIFEKADLILLCMRPHQLAPILQSLPSDLDLKERCMISLLAGVTAKETASYFKRPPTVLRVMPNTPMEIGEGMMLFTWYPQPTEHWQPICRQLFSPLGKIEEIKEDQMDLLTVISGSGPALVMKLIGGFVKKAMTSGISKEKALHIVCQTFSGSARLLAKDLDLDKLVSEIAVPGGVTEQAVYAYDDAKIDSALDKVIEKGVVKAKNLV